MNAQDNTYLFFLSSSASQLQSQCHYCYRVVTISIFLQIKKKFPSINIDKCYRQAKSSTGW